MVWHFLSLLFLILIANGSPILARYLMRTTLSCPIDFGYRFADQQRLFGEAKTWRGFFSSLIATGVSALLVGYDLATGLLIAMGAMSGDLISSFFKRRLGFRSSARAPLLDQVPESLLPALLVMHLFQLSTTDILMLVCIFFILDAGLSRLFYWLGVRRKPY